MDSGSSPNQGHLHGLWSRTSSQTLAEKGPWTQTWAPAAAWAWMPPWPSDINMVSGSSPNHCHPDGNTGHSHQHRHRQGQQTQIWPLAVAQAWALPRRRAKRLHRFLISVCSSLPSCLHLPLLSTVHRAQASQIAFSPVSPPHTPSFPSIHHLGDTWAFLSSSLPRTVGTGPRGRHRLCSYV